MSSEEAPSPAPALVCSFCKKPQMQPRNLDEATAEQIMADSGITFEASDEEGAAAICGRCVQQFWTDNAFAAGFLMDPMHRVAFTMRFASTFRRATALTRSPATRAVARDLFASAVGLVLQAEALLDEAGVFFDAEPRAEGDDADG